MDREGHPPSYEESSKQQPSYNSKNGPPTQYQSGYPYPQQPGYPLQQQPGMYQPGVVYSQQPSPHGPGTYVMPPPMPYAGPLPDSHSTLAWLTCLFCCWPLGLIAIVKSMEVNNSISQGDIVRANTASQSARKFGMASLIFGVCSWISFILLMVIYFVILIPKIKDTYNH